ncbi:hypothetical protein BB560_003855 [Smittium megazygosporum]|uniref:RRM domain-containing protein n=1 Tax=Smittium megazygosporum TaxID=133381 RepID=A0A2T9ZAU0_9FUNG|nr:hypothetical protein BB560_003855 [Smittium megazygosporum]
MRASQNFRSNNTTILNSSFNPSSSINSKVSAPSFHSNQENTKHASRTLYFGNIPPSFPVTELLNQITEGSIDNVRNLYMKLANGLKKIHFGNKGTYTSQRGQGVKVGWGKSIPINKDVSAAIELHNASRAVYIGNFELSEDLKSSDINKDGTSSKNENIPEKEIVEPVSNANEENIAKSKSENSNIATGGNNKDIPGSESEKRNQLDLKNDNNVNANPLNNSTTSDSVPENLKTKIDGELPKNEIEQTQASQHTNENSLDDAETKHENTDSLVSFDTRNIEGDTIRKKSDSDDLNTESQKDKEDISLDHPGYNDDFELMPPEFDSEIGIDDSQDNMLVDAELDNDGSIDLSFHHEGGDFLFEDSDSIAELQSNEISNDLAEQIDLPASEEASGQTTDKQQSSEANKTSIPTFIHLSKEELKSQLSQFGEIEFIRSNPSRKCVFVYFLSVSSAIRCVKNLAKNPGWGSPIKVNYAKDRCNKPELDSNTQIFHGQNYKQGTQNRSIEYSNDFYKEGYNNPGFYSQAEAGTAYQHDNAYGHNMNLDSITNRDKNQGNRCIYIGGVDPSITVEELCNYIRGGPVQIIKQVKEKHACFVTFLYPQDAENFFYLATSNIIRFKNKQFKIGWGSHTGQLPFSIKSAVEKGATRAVYISNLPPNTTIATLRADFGIFGEVEYINIVKAKHTGFIHFTDINNAITTVNSMRTYIELTKNSSGNLNDDEEGSNTNPGNTRDSTTSPSFEKNLPEKYVEGYNSCRFDYAKDRCALPVRSGTFGSSDNPSMSGMPMVNGGFPGQDGFVRPPDFSHRQGYSNNNNPLSASPTNYSEPSFSGGPVYNQAYSETATLVNPSYPNVGPSPRGNMYGGNSLNTVKSGPVRGRFNFVNSNRQKGHIYKSGPSSLGARNGSRNEVFNKYDQSASSKMGYLNRTPKQRIPNPSVQKAPGFIEYPSVQYNPSSGIGAPSQQQPYGYPSQGYDGTAGYSNVQGPPGAFSSIYTGGGSQQDYYYQQPPPNYASATYNYPTPQGPVAPGNAQYSQLPYADPNYRPPMPPGQGPGQIQNRLGPANNSGQTSTMPLSLKE